ncbi:uncharacterized protein LOC114328662 isoform X2 [Diabrotica virgifera virgifera]|uniref:Uncharacterized protein LOC114328662 n=1 Tax=Diabrotica virgifera virgifera TaxID=50390 RepID=A0A6P7FJL0_DIAVI|nr:uncharacterized protein LOC114328662 isoform X2 [Diabrotica virgifera virgifera]
MKPVLCLSCLISFVFVHSEVINFQFKNYTIIEYTNLYSIPLWYLYSSKASYIKQTRREPQEYLKCTKGNTSQLCSCLQAYVGNSDATYMPFKEKEEASVDLEKFLVSLPSGTTCCLNQTTCQDPAYDLSIGICLEYKKYLRPIYRLNIQSSMVEEYTINLNTILVFVYKGNRTTLQLLHCSKNNPLLWCTNRLDMMVYRGSLEAYNQDNSTANRSPRELGCYPKIFDSNDKNTPSSESLWIIQFVWLPVIVALILLHLILSCLQFKSLNLKNGKSVKQEKTSERYNNTVNKDQTNSNETYYESIDYYDAINSEVKNELYKEQ